MPPLPVIEYPDPRLRVPAEPVVSFDAALASLVEALLETLQASGGIGLAAPQVGHSRQVLVVDSRGPVSEPREYVNPEILSRSGLAIGDESCLSLPGISAKVMRSAEVRVRARDRSGRSFERDLEGMHALCLQHEMDHLAGKLFIDRLSTIRRLRLRSALAAMRRRAAASERIPC